LNNCCLQINDMGKAIKRPQIEWERTRKGWTPDDLLGGWFSTIGGCKTKLGAITVIVLGWLILPCLLPLVMWSLSTLIEAIVE
jgi:hypothetical protein